MADITTRAQLYTAMAFRQDVQIMKFGSATVDAGGFTSILNITGNPGTGTLAGTSTTQGVVPTDNDAGFPPINAFVAGNTGVLDRVHFGAGSQAAQWWLYDLLFKAGAYANNATAVALSSQPSYSARLPVSGGNPVYVGLQIWVEIATAMTGTPAWTVTYTNQAGVGGRTATISPGVVNPRLARMFQMNLQAGDTGVRSIDSVTCTGATVGTFNILVMRPLWTGRVALNNDGDSHPPSRTSMPQVFDTSALYLVMSSDSTTTGVVPEFTFGIVNRQSVSSPNDDDFIAACATRQEISWLRVIARTTTAAHNFSMLDIAGSQSGGVLGGSNTANGVVPDDTTLGFPGVNSFGGLNGYIDRIHFHNSVSSRMKLVDLLFKAGTYNFNNGTTTLTAQPSYLSRLPNGDAKGLQILFEAVTTWTGTATITVTYTNQDGVTGRTTPAFTVSAPIAGRIVAMPLQAGDSGVQKIESIASTTGTAGTFNILVVRLLWMGRCGAAGDGDAHGPYRSGLVPISDTAALYPIVLGDSTSSGTPEMQIGVVHL